MLPNRELIVPWMAWFSARKQGPTMGLRYKRRTARYKGKTVRRLTAVGSSRNASVRALEVIALGSGQCIRLEKGAQEERILGDVLPENVTVERAIGQPPHERMFEAAPCNVCVLLPL